MSGITIYDYWSYKEFLTDWFNKEKEVNPIFSYQYFANKAGFKSKAFIANVIAGRKKISTDSLLKLAKAMVLKKNEIRYLEALIQFDNATDDMQKEYYRDQLLHLKPANPAYNLERIHTEYLESWYISAIREMVVFSDFNDDFKKLASQLKPTITTQQAKHAVKLLLDLNLIKKKNTKTGVTYSQTEHSIETPPFMPRSLAIRNHQKKMITLGSESIERFHKDERNIQCSTLCINDEGVTALNALMSDFYGKLVKIATDHEKGAERVFEMDLVFFPLSVKK
ncbi:MAG: TIGR02147 family protein [Fibrobacterales bacterium]